MKLLANIGYLRENAPSHLAFKSVGRLFYDAEKHKCKVLLYAFHQGLCIAKPNGGAPFLQGDIIQAVGTWEERVQTAFIGFISTTETDKGEHVYSISLEACPVIRVDVTGIWLNVNLEDSETFKEDIDCPF
jgi:hypothetical protein